MMATIPIDIRIALTIFVLGIPPLMICITGRSFWWVLPSGGSLLYLMIRMIWST